MALLLGIDTGGTYTDAVLFDDGTADVVATGKAPTTHRDLGSGIRAAVESVMATSAVPPADVALVSLSTTLATNALVEGRGDRVGLVYVGFGPGAIERGGLDAALAGDPVLELAGGHTSAGEPREALDLDAVRHWARDIAGSVAAVAVAAQFSVRNPEHERAVRDLVRREFGLPVTCSHELSARLDGPRRAVTCVLNARLIGLIDALTESARAMLSALGFDAPVMVVRGDGSLVSAEFASERPIETILSGPAASLVGAAHLTSVGDGFVADIGGTTTDLALMEGGRPSLARDGARVGGHRTMVEAIDVETHGLGGDSRVAIDERTRPQSIAIGPRRVVPVSMLAVTHADTVHESLDRHMRSDVRAHTDGRFLIPVGLPDETRAAHAVDREVLSRVGDQPVAMSAIVRSRRDASAVDRLVRAGILIEAGFTPTDAAHVVGHQDTWDADAATKAARLGARLWSAAQEVTDVDARSFSEMVIERLVRRSADILIGHAFAADGLAPGAVGDAAVRAALDRRFSKARVDVGVALPIIALGASAPIYYPGVGRLLRSDVVIPDNAEVANAIGAVVGRVELVRRVSVSVLDDDGFRVHLPDGPRDVADLDGARAIAFDALEPLVRRDALDAGADAVEVRRGWDVTSITSGDRVTVIEATATVVATGRPRLARA